MRKSKIIEGGKVMGGLTILYFVWVILLMITHLNLTVIVYRDAQSRHESPLGIPPFLWLGVAFSMPVIGMFIYWIMNYSSLKSNSIYGKGRFYSLNKD